MPRERTSRARQQQESRDNRGIPCPCLDPDLACACLREFRANGLAPVDPVAYPEREADRIGSGRANSGSACHRTRPESETRSPSLRRGILPHGRREVDSRTRVRAAKVTHECSKAAKPDHTRFRSQAAFLSSLSILTRAKASVVSLISPSGDQQPLHQCHRSPERCASRWPCRRIGLSPRFDSPLR